MLPYNEKKDSVLTKIRDNAIKMAKIFLKLTILFMTILYIYSDVTFNLR